MSTLLRLVPGLLCLAATLPCQNEEGTEDMKQAEDVRRAKAAGRELSGKGEGEGDDDSQLTPEQRLARHITSGAHQHCRFLATLKPEKLMPGQTGTLTILATLVGNAVLPAPAAVEVLSNAHQGEVTLGALAARPATIGRHAAGYVGRPVYDNYALLDVPVTMAPSAQVGSKHVVAVEMKFDLHDGGSGQAIGRFLDRVATTIEVGQPNDPAVQGRARGPSVEEPAPAPASAETRPDRTPESGAPAPEPRIEARTVVPDAEAPASTPVGSTADSTGPELSAPDTGLPMPLLIGGGVLLLGVVVLLARRR